MGYTEEELAKFREDPHKEYILEHAHLLDEWTIVAEVIASHGCATDHQVGHRFYFSPHGVFLSERGPAKPCLHILTAVSPAVIVIQERILSGLSPEPHMLRHVGCIDTGVACGGWGQVALRLYTQPNQEKRER
jgi:uncharacterized repeat protein (TIGR04076 family)